jgi:hypothetical protein
MPKSEGKSSETEDDDSYQTPRVNDIVSSFAEFCTSSDMTEDMDDFEREHCSAFKGWEEDGEQELRWTDLHRRYVELVEGKMEGFLVDSDVPPEELMELLSQASDDERVAEFLPQVILNTEYLRFASQMKVLADEARERADAEEAGEDAKAGNVSGVYKIDKTNPFDKKRFGEYVGGVGGERSGARRAGRSGVVRKSGVQRSGADRTEVCCSRRPQGWLVIRSPAAGGVRGQVRPRRPQWG